jgi:hypothetical protein
MIQLPSRSFPITYSEEYIQSNAYYNQEVTRVKSDATCIEECETVITTKQAMCSIALTHLPWAFHRCGKLPHPPPLMRPILSAPTYPTYQFAAPFLSQKGGAIISYAAWYTVKKYAALAEIEGVTSHALRHTVATQLVRDPETNLVAAATFLGHSGLDTAAWYNQPSIEDLEKAATLPSRCTSSLRRRLSMVPQKAPPYLVGSLVTRAGLEPATKGLRIPLSHC